MQRLYKANKELCDIINSRVWIELKKHIWMIRCRQQIQGMPVFKVIDGEKVYVFASDQEENATNIYMLNDESKTKVLRNHANYVRWTGKYESLFLEFFDYLLVDYGFKFKSQDFDNAVTENNEFFFYGPVYCYSLYNDFGCINFILLVQRGEWDVYLTDKFYTEQSEIRKGKYISDVLKTLKTYSQPETLIISNYNYISTIGQSVQKEIEQYGEFFGIKVVKSDSSIAK